MIEMDLVAAAAAAAGVAVVVDRSGRDAMVLCYEYVQVLHFYFQLMDAVLIYYCLAYVSMYSIRVHAVHPNSFYVVIN